MGYTVIEQTIRGDGKITDGKEKSATRVFFITFDATTPPTTLAAVRDVAGLPAYLSTLPGDTSLLRREMNFESNGDGTGLHWIATADYDASYSAADEEEPNPLDDPPRITWDAAEGGEKWFLDHSDPPKPYQNSAGCPFQELPERKSGSFAIKVTKNMATFPAALAVAARFVTNNGSVTIDGVEFATGELLHGIPSCGPKQVRNEIEYREVTTTFYIAPSHELEVLDQGFQELIDDELHDIVKGQPPTRVDVPAPLNGSGRWDWDQEEPVTLTFVPYKPANFSSILTAFGLT